MSVAGTATDVKLVALQGLNAEKIGKGAFRWKLNSSLAPPSNLVMMAVRLEQFNCKVECISIKDRAARLSVGVDNVILNLDSLKNYYTAADVVTAWNTVDNLAKAGNLTLAYDADKHKFSLSLPTGSSAVGAYVNIYDSPLMIHLGFAEDITLNGGDTLEAPYNPDLVGSRYIKVDTNMMVTNMGPNINDYEKMLAIIPIETTDMMKGNLTFSAQTHCSHFYTIPSRHLYEIELYLRDDRDEPVELVGNFVATLAFSYRDPPMVPPSEHMKEERDPVRIDMYGKSYKKRMIGDSVIGGGV